MTGLILLAVGLAVIAWQAVVAVWNAATTARLRRQQRLRDALHAEAELQAAQDQAMRIANSTSWREFVRAHLLEGCPDCSQWDAAGDRPVPKPCEKHKEGAQ